MAVSILGFSVPTFWVGLILILPSPSTLGWLPAGEPRRDKDASSASSGASSPSTAGSI